jgi:flagellar basal-body rod protein FlgB
MIPSLFNETMSLLEKSLDLRGRRHEILVSNVVNQDTPGYRARELNFEEVLQSIATGKKSQLVRTNPKHLSPGGGPGGSEGGIVLSENPAGYDGNNVNVEQEMTRMAENSLLYNASAQIVSKKFQGLKAAIHEGRF